MNKKSFYIKTFGCQMNIYDSDKMKDIFLSHGLREETDFSDADYVVLNTCHIREKATEKTYSDLGRIHKKAKSNPKIIVSGCVAQAEGDLIQQRAPYVDLVLGPQSLHLLDDYLTENLKQGTVIEFDPIDKFDSLSHFKRFNNSKNAFITIQEGCDKFCTFCVVPYTRGSEYSRPVREIINEAKQLVDNGVKEISLLGQNVNAYHGLNDENETQTLTHLIQQLSEIEDLSRITYTTSHPINMTNELIQEHGRNPKLIPYLHLPVQSGSNRILKLMNRKHTREFYFEVIDKLKAQNQHIALSSDFIVGFPGETDNDFQDTLDLIHQVEFMNSYSFKYSPRPGTPASLKDQLPEAVKDERLGILQELLNKQQYEFNQKFIKKVVNVLFDSNGTKPGQVKGKSEYNQSVAVNGDPTFIGSIAPVEITEVMTHSLKGELRVSE